MAPVVLSTPQPTTTGAKHLKEDLMALDSRHRDKGGEISRRHGNTLIRTLRKTYGQSFAGSYGNKKKLGEVLHKLDEPS